MTLPPVSARWALAVFLGCAAAFVAVDVHWLDGLRLDVGSVYLTTPRFTLFGVMLLLIGGPAAFALALGLAPWFEQGNGAKLVADLKGANPKKVTALLFVFGLLLPLAIQSGLLDHAPLTDDEGSYLFSAELFASNRLWVPSPPWKLFFDNAFLVNNGRLYSQYFPGWPLLLSLGLRLGVPWLINPLLSATTVVLVFRAARRWWSPAWALLAALVYLGSPFAQVGAATGMSHTPTLTSLSLAVWCFAHLDTGDSRRRWSAGLAAAVAVGFLVRPSCAVGFGVPLIGAWALRVWRLSEPKARLSHLATFVAAAAPLAALFFLYNTFTHGSPFETGYHALHQASEASGYRFAAIRAPAPNTTSKLLFFSGDLSPLVLLANAVIALFRLNVDAFGWPSSLLFLAFARGKVARVLVACLVGLMLTAAPAPDGGIDSFGPVHYSELLVPLALLTAAGLQAVHRFATGLGRPGLVAGLMVGSAIVSAAFYLPVRFVTLARLADDVNRPRRFLEELAPRPSVIFATRPFAPSCAAAPARHFVFFRPNSSPDLDDPLLLVNHVSLARDRQFLARYPGRQGFVFLVDRASCVPRLIPLEQATEAQIPDAVKEQPGDFPAWAIPEK